MTSVLASCIVVMVGVGCGGAESPSAVPAQVEHEWVCSEGYEEPSGEPSAEARDKLGGTLATHIQVADPCERITVVVTYQGDRERLVAAGLSTGYDRDGVVSGHIEVRRVLALATLPEVARIEMEPRVEPD